MRRASPRRVNYGSSHFKLLNLREKASLSTRLQRKTRWQNPQRPLEARAFPPVLAAIILLGGGIYYLSTPSSTDTTLNTETFVPYTITSRQAISPSSFIFTVTPNNANPSPNYLHPQSSTWRYPLWSVEFKQPEVQIARNYTPLPPLHGEDPATGSLRFYVRAIGGGEMSTYLSRLGVGQGVWLRGPHPGFDIMKRLGDQKDVVFLAGGTGIVPGLQVARTVLDGRSDTSFTLLWAVRKREELQGVKPGSSSSWSRLWRRPLPEEVQQGIQSASPMGRELDEMKKRYGDRLKIHIAIDEEKTQFKSVDLSNKLQNFPSKSQHATGCQLHDQRLHMGLSEFEPTTPPCICTTSEQSQPGKNLFMVSGPEGFIAHYTGPKVWLAGVETQGLVSGVAGELLRKHPWLASDWLVLKL